MSRNGSGVYSLPAGNPVVTGTTISSSWANTTLSDIATALTGSVAADGQTAMTGNLQMGNNKITGLAVATSSGDALSFGQAATISALTVTGAFAANGGATLGDASGDALTINSSAVSIPNGLNFDSNTFVIDATNNRVGVGTASPSQRLHVASAGTVAIQAENTASTGAAYLKSTNTATTCNFGVDATGGYIETLGAYATLFYTNSAERMRIDSSGAVGIGASATNRLNLSYDGGSGQANIGPNSTGGSTFLTLGTSSSGTYSERMRIDSSGNVGIGTSSPVSIAGYTIQTLNNATTGSGVCLQSAGTDRGRFLVTSTAAFVGARNGLPLVFEANATEAMRIDTSGNVGIGTSSPSKLFEVRGADAVARFRGSSIQYLDITATNGGTVNLDANNGTAFAFSVNATERMRIDGSGNLLVGTTSARPNGLTSDGAIVSINNGSRYAAHFAADSTSPRTAVQFSNPNGNIGTIQLSGTSTSYVTSSDYRLKENIAPMTGALATVSALNPVTYTWKVDGSDGQGFIAHELQEVVPDCVVGTKDAVDADGNPQYQGIDTSFLVATLTAAIQEMKAIIDAQAERITALENK